MRVRAHPLFTLLTSRARVLICSPRYSVTYTLIVLWLRHLVRSTARRLAEIFAHRYSRSMKTAMEHCWTHRPAPERRSKWLTLCRFDTNLGEPRLIVADLQNSVLLLLDEEGRYQCDLLRPQLAWRPAGVAAGVQNTLAVCDWASNAVSLHFFDADLNHQRAELLGRSNLTRPYSVAMTTVGNWVVADHDSLLLLDPFGGLIRRVQLPSPPRHVTTDTKQRIIVSCPQSGHVLICDPAGSPIRQLEGLNHPSGVLVSDLDRLLVCDQKRGAVALFDYRGSHLYDVIARDRSLPRSTDPLLAPDRWLPVSITSTTPGQAVLAAAYDQDFVIQCFAYDFVPSSSRSTASMFFSR